MDALEVSGILLPVPEDWQVTSDGRYCKGDGGLIDVRAKSITIPLDHDRLRAVQEELATRDAKVALISVQGIDCLYCSYIENECSVVTYSFGISLDNEIVAVYVFRPGYEDLARQVDEWLLNPKL